MQIYSEYDNDILNTCYGCNTKLTNDEYNFYIKNTDTCCDGYMCGCYGMPVHPPYCDKCMESKQNEGTE